jgi:hypothetical protein
MRTAYTKQEDNIILENIRQYPNNLQFAFERSSEELNRTASAISKRYYNKLRDSAKIAVGSNKGLILNTKNTIRDNSKYNMVLDLTSSLTLRDKKNLIKYLFDEL